MGQLAHSEEKQKSFTFKIQPINQQQLVYELTIIFIITFCQPAKISLLIEPLLMVAVLLLLFLLPFLPLFILLLSLLLQHFQEVCTRMQICKKPSSLLQIFLSKAKPISMDQQSLKKNFLKLVSQTFIKATLTKIVIISIKDTKTILKSLV